MKQTKILILAACVVVGLFSGFSIGSGGWILGLIAIGLLVGFGKHTGYWSIWYFSLSAGIGMGKLMPEWWFNILLGMILGLALSLILRYRLMTPEERKA